MLADELSYVLAHTTQQTWSGFSPTIVPENNRQSGLSATTVSEMSTGKYELTLSMLREGKISVHRLGLGGNMVCNC